MHYKSIWGGLPHTWYLPFFLLPVLRKLWGVVTFADGTSRGTVFPQFLYLKYHCYWQSHQGPCYVCRDPTLRCQCVTRVLDSTVVKGSQGWVLHCGSSRYPPLLTLSAITARTMVANTDRTLQSFCLGWMSTKELFKFILILLLLHPYPRTPVWVYEGWMEDIM